MVVTGGQDVLPLPELQSSVEQAQPHGGAVGQGDLGRVHSKVFGGSAEHVGFEALCMIVQVVRRVFVQPPAMGLDRLADRPRVRGEEESSQVNIVARQIELATHCPPVLKVRRRLPADQLEPRPAAGGEDTSAKDQPGPDEKTSPNQHSRPPSSGSPRFGQRTCGS